MRILVLQESDWVERGPHQNHQLLERMAARGHEVRVIDFEIGWSTRPGQSRIAPRRVILNVHKVLENGGVTVVHPAFVRLPVFDNLSMLLTHALEIRRQFRGFHPEVVVGFGILNAFLGIWAARRNRVPFVHYVIDELHKLMPRPALRGLSKLVEQADFRQATQVLSISESMCDYTIAMGAPPERVKILRAGVDLNRYSAADGSPIRQRYGITPDEILLFFMGWLYPFSGLMEIAEAVVAASVGTPKVKLLVIGKGELWEPLNQLASKDKVARRLILEPWRPYEEVPYYLAAADLCLLPAHMVDVMENIVPIKMYEYMAAGKPVVATRLPGLVREFGEGHGVVYVDGPEQAATKVLELAGKGGLAELGAQARAFVSGNDWEKITNKFEGDLRGLVEQTNANTQTPGRI